MMQKSSVIHAYVMFVFKRMLWHSSIICVRHHFMLDGIESLLLFIYVHNNIMKMGISRKDCQFHFFCLILHSDQSAYPTSI
ncbi:hypothetical protein L1987_64337 [Smallanthus sonchifolius]|uniref:Uncharacterized protein n=1 Tax=Smallanthus sonchifolius TaxID=185202 RepID=A0ACB9CFQ4_9ASTR|nr:hypothetical protein L1987_64337 [Smallanthus sonchifolius]